MTLLTFIAYTAFVALYSWYKLRKENLNSKLHLPHFDDVYDIVPVL